MHFADFKNSIPKLQNAHIGGIKSQFQLAPTYRKRYDIKKIYASNPRLASVLIIFFPNRKGQTSFVLMKRSNYDGHHARQISFPGGKKEAADANLIETALRETEEEIGLQIKPDAIFKQLTEIYIPPSKFLVHPFMAMLDSYPKFNPNYEVEEIITPTLSDLLEPDAIQKREVQTLKEKTVKTACFVFDNQIVWGATAMILSELRKLFIDSFSK